MSPVNGLESRSNDQDSSVGRRTHPRAADSKLTDDPVLWQLSSVGGRKAAILASVNLMAL